tara:strand:+ start:1416 stop:1697 length:282 start_codon:yes stop_codon:yes gene_type:complete
VRAFFKKYAESEPAEKAESLDELNAQKKYLSKLLEREKQIKMEFSKKKQQQVWDQRKETQSCNSPIKQHSAPAPYQAPRPANKFYKVGEPCEI